MPEVRTFTTLVKKRDEIRAPVRTYEAKITQAHSDLSHLTAVLQRFEVSGRGRDLARLHGRLVAAVLGRTCGHEQDSAALDEI